MGISHSYVSLPEDTHNKHWLNMDLSKLYDFRIWVCLKIVNPIVPNGFADHYPY